MLYIKGKLSFETETFCMQSGQMVEIYRNFIYRIPLILIQEQIYCLVFNQNEHMLIWQNIITLFFCQNVLITWGKKKGQTQSISTSSEKHNWKWKCFHNENKIVPRKHATHKWYKGKAEAHLICRFLLFGKKHAFFILSVLKWHRTNKRLLCK